MIDLRTVAPLDMAPILESVHKTSRLLIADEAVVPFGIGAEIAATVARDGFWDLDAPIERIGAAATPPPYAPELERALAPRPRRHRRGDPPSRVCDCDPVWTRRGPIGHWRSNQRGPAAEGAAITRCWISLVPSPISSTLASQ